MVLKNHHKGLQCVLAFRRDIKRLEELRPGGCVPWEWLVEIPRKPALLAWVHLGSLGLLWVDETLFKNFTLRLG